MARKHKIECPHCKQLFEFVPPVKKKKLTEITVTKVFNDCRLFWLEEFHKGWSFDGAEAGALKKLLDKIRTTIEQGGKFVYSEQQHTITFKYFCWHLSEYYKGKDLKVLNSKFNEIIEQMRNGNTKTNDWHQKNSTARYNSANEYRS